MNRIHLHTITQMTVKTLLTTCAPFYSENGSKPFKSNLSTKSNISTMTNCVCYDHIQLSAIIRDTSQKVSLIEFTGI